MATFSKRRNGDGSTSWDALVRVTGYPPIGRSFRTKLAADLWASRTEAARKGRTAVAVRRGMTFGNLLDDALPRLTNPAAAIFAYWREALGDVLLEKITPDLIAIHRDRLTGADCRGYNHKTTKPRSEATTKNYMIELSRLFTLAVRELRVLEVNPCSAVTKPSPSKEVVRWLSDDERERLLAACKASDSPDLYLVVLFCLTTGCRKGEAAGLLWRDVDLRRRWAVFPRTKNGSARGVPLTNAVCALLASRRRDDARVFPTEITKAWLTAVARAGIVDFRFHDLRHSCASALVQNGANLAEVATLLGHKGLAMSLRYSHVGNDGTTRLVDRVMGDVQ